MKKTERTCMITQILSENPNRDFSLGYFARLFGCAKSSVSEDIKVVRSAMDAAGYGYVETTSGAKGGVRYVPYISDDECRRGLEKICEKLREPDRRMGGGFIYTTDVMYDPSLIKSAARAFAKRFAAVDADIVVTVETKGIAVAMLTAELLGLPLVVVRREVRVSEGSTLSINFFSGSDERIQKMSLAKRAVKPGSKAIIIDDFMRRGGSVKGINDMLAEFDAQTVGIGVVIYAGGKRETKVFDFYPLLLIEEDGDDFSIKVNEQV